ncbi:MAG: DUF2764 family protein [Bacteroides sp.]
MRSKYYYLIAGLPDLTLEDGKLSYTVADFKSELYNQLSTSDKKLIDLFYLKFDNMNVLNLLKGKEEAFDFRGNFTLELLQECIADLKEGKKIDSKVLPIYLSTFIFDVLSSETVDFVALENKLMALYYEYAMKSDNKFLTAWFDFNLSINNILLALSARKYEWDVASNIVGQTWVCDALRTSHARDFGLSTELEYFEQLNRMSEITDWVEREKKIDQLRWSWMDEATFFDYFTIERLFIFLLRLEMIERWIALDKEKGNQYFRSIIHSLKSEVTIPEEFR